VAAFASPVTHGFRVNGDALGEIMQGLRQRWYAARASGWSGGDTNTPGSGAVTLNAPGNGLSVPLFLQIQNDIETIVTRFVDHAEVEDSGGGPLDEIPMYSLSSWRSAAGLNSGGFRRATSFDGSATPTWSYGKIAHGDILGWWIWEDIVKGLQALKWTHVLSGQTQPFLGTRAFGTNWPTFAEALASHDGAWPYEFTQSAGTTPQILAYRHHTTTWDVHSLVNAYKWRFSITDFSAEGLVVPEDTELWEMSDVPGNWENATHEFWSPYGWTKDKWYQFATDRAPSGWGNWDTECNLCSWDDSVSPLEAAGLDSEGSNMDRRSDYSGAAILKWTFDND
jgi:hypothetical protein